MSGPSIIAGVDERPAEIGSTAVKLVSSLTLFRAAAEQLGREDPVYASLAGRLAASLELTSAQGYPACDFTLAQVDSVRRDIQ